MYIYIVSISRYTEYAQYILQNDRFIVRDCRGIVILYYYCIHYGVGR